MLFLQIAFLIAVLMLMALIGFTSLTLFEQFRLCTTPIEKWIMLLSFALGCTLTTQLVLGEAAPILIGSLLAGGAIKIHKRSIE